MDRIRVLDNGKPTREDWVCVTDFPGYPEPVVATRTVDTWTKRSAMVDSIHGPKNRPDSSVLHSKVLTSAPRYGGNFEYDVLIGIPPNVTAYHYAFTVPESRIYFPDGAVPTIPDTWVGNRWENFLGSSMAEAIQQFQNEASLANFLIELKDFKRSIRDARKLFHGFGTGRTFFSRVGSFLHDRAQQGVGGNFLDVELNWKSFVKDIPDILNAYGKAMKRLEFLVGHQHFVTHHRKRFLIEPHTEGFDTVGVFSLSELMPSTSGGYSVRLEPVQCQVEFNSSLYMDNKLELEDINTWWAVADQLGLNNSPKIVWNAVKLSWVVDMFIDADAFLNAFEVQAYKGSLVPMGGTCSWKVTRFYDVVVRHAITPDPFYTESVVGSVRFTDYSRGPHSMGRPVLFSLHAGLSPSQIALLTGLADSLSGASGAGYRVSQRFAQTFVKNKHTFGRNYWKRVGIKTRRRNVRLSR